MRGYPKALKKVNVFTVGEAILTNVERGESVHFDRLRCRAVCRGSKRMDLSLIGTVNLLLIMEIENIGDGSDEFISIAFKDPPLGKTHGVRYLFGVESLIPSLMMFLAMS